MKSIVPAGSPAPRRQFAAAIASGSNLPTKKENEMARLRTPSKHIHQAHQIVTERNQQRLTDAMPGAAPDRSDGDQKVGDVGDMARGEGNTTPVREDFTK
jgi:hypothetical protein